MVRVSSTLIAVSVMASCMAACQSARVQSRFDAKAAEYVLKSGTGRIDGQAFLKRDYGRLVTAAGERVFLLPATAYTMERFDRMFGGDRRAYFGTEIEDTPPEYYRYRRETKVDMTGKFSFEDVAPVPYIVATRVFWTGRKSYFTHGGAVYDLVEVRKD